MEFNFYSTKWCWVRDDESSAFLFSMLPQQAGQIREEENHRISRKCNILGQVFMRSRPWQRKMKLNEDAAGSWLVHLLMFCALHDRRHYRDSTKSRKSISRLLEVYKLAGKCRYMAQTEVKERLLNKGPDPDPNPCMPLTECQILGNWFHHLRLSFLVWSMRELKTDGFLDF